MESHDSALIESKIENDSALIEPKIEIDVAEETPACWLTGNFYQDTESQSVGDYGCSSNTNADSTDVERVVIKTEPKEEPDTASDEKPALSHSVDTDVKAMTAAYSYSNRSEIETRTAERLGVKIEVKTEVYVDCQAKNEVVSPLQSETTGTPSSSFSLPGQPTPTQLQKLGDSDEETKSQGPGGPTSQPCSFLLQNHTLCESEEESESSQTVYPSPADPQTSAYTSCSTQTIFCIVKIKKPRHKSVQTAQKEFECNACGKTFPLKASLKSHKSVFHVAHKKFVCHICEKACFAWSGELKQHMATHKAHKNLVCDVCRKAFSSAGGLKAHMFTHTGQKDFVCNVCEKAFASAYGLKSHMSVHAEKDFICDICQRAFSKASYLKDHKLGHTGQKDFKCNVCEKAYARAGELKRHMKKHGPKNFKCNVCEKAFARPCSLKSHMKIHTRPKNYVCDVCKKAFSLAKDLKMHQYTHWGFNSFKTSLLSQKRN